MMSPLKGIRQQEKVGSQTRCMTLTPCVLSSLLFYPFNNLLDVTILDLWHCCV